jgi:hypothetical protein
MSSSIDKITATNINLARKIASCMSELNPSAKRFEITCSGALDSVESSNPEWASSTFTLARTILQESWVSKDAYTDLASALFELIRVVTTKDESADR